MNTGEGDSTGDGTCCDTDVIGQQLMSDVHICQGTRAYECARGCEETAWNAPVWRHHADRMIAEAACAGATTRHCAHMKKEPGKAACRSNTCCFMARLG